MVGDECQDQIRCECHGWRRNNLLWKLSRRWRDCQLLHEEELKTKSPITKAIMMIEAARIIKSNFIVKKRV